MKNLTFGIACLGLFVFGSPELKAQGMASPGGFECKVEILVCNIFTGTFRQICHQNDNGVSCVCGESTTC